MILLSVIGEGWFKVLTLSPSATSQIFWPVAGLMVGKVFPLAESTNSLLMKSWKLICETTINSISSFKSLLNWSSTVVFILWRLSFKVFERFSGRTPETLAESVRCSNLGRDRRKLLKQVVTSPLPNARQQKGLGWILEEGCSVFQYMCYTLKYLHCSMAMCLDSSSIFAALQWQRIENSPARVLNYSTKTYWKCGTGCCF